MTKKELENIENELKEYVTNYLQVVDKNGNSQPEINVVASESYNIPPKIITEINRAWDKMKVESEKISEHKPLEVLECEIEDKLNDVLKEKQKLVSTVLFQDRIKDKLIGENIQLRQEVAELTTDFNKLKDSLIDRSFLKKAINEVENYLFSKGWLYSEDRGYIDPKDGQNYSFVSLCFFIQTARDDLKNYEELSSDPVRIVSGVVISADTLRNNNISVRDFKTLKTLV